MIAMTVAPTRPKEDDELDELPPLDADEEPSADGDDGEGIETDDSDSLDDAESNDVPMDALETVGAEGGWLKDAEDADDLEIEDDELTAFEGVNEAGGDFDDLGVGEEDFGLAAGEQQRHMDGGEEGPSEPDEELRDQDLPALDADEEGEIDDASLVESAFAPAADTSIPRAARAWKGAGAPLDVGAARGVAVVGRGAIVAADGLVRVDLEGACEPLAGPGEPVERLAAGFGIVAAVTESGALALSRDDGATFVIARSGEDENALRDVAVSRFALWVLRRDGVLETATHAAAEWTRVFDASGTIAIAVESHEAVALLTDRGFVTRDMNGHDGAYLSNLAAPGSTALALFGDALLVAVHRELEDATWIVKIAADGERTVVAEVSGAPSSSSDDCDGGAVRALAVDSGHGVVWIAGDFGLLALEPSGG
jgi:hypothetical protein